MSDTVISNPLDFAGTPVGFEAVGLAPNAGHAKDGTPYYKLTLFFRHKSEWDVFQLAKLKGARFAVVMNRVDEGAASGPTEKGTDKLAGACEDPRPDKKKRHLSETTVKAYELCRDEDFLEWVGCHCSPGTGGASEDMARSYILSYTHCKHRSDIDKSPDSAKKFGQIVAAFEKWKEGR